LRALLGLTATICLMLGGRHLLETYGNRVDVENVEIGAPIRIKATCFHFFGPAECEFSLGYTTADGSELSEGTLGWSDGPLVKRSWLCFYSFESELWAVNRPCQLIVYFHRHEKPAGQGGDRVWTLQEKVVDVK